jgi:hypothetical protein
MNARRVFAGIGLWRLMAACIATAETNLEITGFANGYLTWTNVDPSVYYTVEWRASLTGTNGWTGSYRGCQDLRSSNQTITVPAPAFYRVAGTTNPAHTRVLSAAGAVVEAGYYEATNLTQVATNLVAGNIRAGVNLFGLAGTLAAGSAYPAPIPKTGQTPTIPLNLAPTGSDGHQHKGVTWPDQRFTDNANGTVTDNLTGLIWLKSANALGVRTWANALTACNTLNSGEAGLTDGSVEGDWRLPNVLEMRSLIDWRYSNPALSNTAGTGQWTSGDAFTGVQSGGTPYWTSTSSMSQPTWGAYQVAMPSGVASVDSKTSSRYVWPVRGGE